MIIKINGKKNTDYKVEVNSFANPFPKKEEDRVQIEGKNGDELLETYYNNFNLEVECFLKSKTIREDIRRLGKYIRQDDEELLININTEPRLFYLGHFNEITNIEQYGASSVKFTVIFNCQPEKYLITDENVDLSKINKKEDIEELDDLQYKKSVNPISGLF